MEPPDREADPGHVVSLLGIPQGHGSGPEADQRRPRSVGIARVRGRPPDRQPDHGPGLAGSRSAGRSEPAATRWNLLPSPLGFEAGSNGPGDSSGVTSWDDFASGSS